MGDEHEHLLPIANVGRIMKQTLPPTAKVSKESKERMQECVSEFISFVTGEASDKCRKENRKTINGDDICWALSTLGFDNFAEATSRYLHKYRECERERADQNKASGAEDTGEASGHGSGQLGRNDDETNISLQLGGSTDRGKNLPADPS